MSQYRVYVEKKESYATEAMSLAHELNENLHLALKNVRIVNVYDVFNINDQQLEVTKQNVLSEKVTDVVSETLDLENKVYFAVEFLPGQYDQRADSAMQCIQLLTGNDEVRVKSGKVILLDEDTSNEDLEKIKHYYINPIEMREKDMDSPLKLDESVEIEDVQIHLGFIDEQLDQFLHEHNMAMTLDDIKLIQAYFCRKEHRNPTETELKVLDTYWSDHCRHTTFETVLQNVTFESGRFHEILESTYNEYCTS